MQLSFLWRISVAGNCDEVSALISENLANAAKARRKNRLGGGESVVPRAQLSGWKSYNTRVEV